MKIKSLLIVGGALAIGALFAGCASQGVLPVQKPEKSAAENQWSTMSQGPYRDKISFATGTDLLHWTDQKTLLAEHASVPDAVALPNGKIIVYFVYVPEDGYPERVGYVSSSDQGKTWSSADFVPIAGLGDKAPADPTPILLADGRVRLFYFDIGESRNPTGSGHPTNKIYSALSDDGINFTEEDGVRFTYDGIYDPTVIQNPDGDWRMYVGNQKGDGVLSATSSDGLDFTYEGVAYTGGAIPDVIYENATYYLFTAGIEIATSSDGKTFTKTNSRFEKSGGGLTADPGVTKLSDGTYLMVYKTSNPTR